MGVVNVTPDSFSDGGLLVDAPHAVDAATAMVAAGADLIDVGGESTRPGSSPVPLDEECRRVLPVVEALAAQVTVPISIDTYKSVVAERALHAGASIVNDVSGLRYDSALGKVAAQHGAVLVLTHTRGRSADMYREASYHDVIDEVLDELRESIAFAIGAGVPRANLIVDPGLGFAKEAPHSFEVLARLHELEELTLPLLVGPSRKSFLTRAVGGKQSPAERDWATAAAVAAAVFAGAHIVRVHAVREMVQVVRVADEIQRYHQQP
jgi:dihydropteroate synthase